MATHIHIHTKDFRTNDFRGSPELKKEIRKALSTANELLASCIQGEAPSIKKVIKFLESAEQNTN